MLGLLESRELLMSVMMGSVHACQRDARRLLSERLNCLRKQHWQREAFNGSTFRLKTESLAISKQSARLRRMETLIKPSLAAPGAGLPAPELWIARGLFALKRRFGSREAFTARFLRERVAIREILAQCPPDRRGEQVLIPRLPGLEDSSRFWSVWMTLEHLCITNTVFAMVIKSLAHGKVPAKKASTADVKPRADLSGDVEANYESSCDAVFSTVAAIAELRTVAKYAHPWFGPLDAAGWHALTATHMAIHRAQIARIVAGLSIR